MIRQQLVYDIPTPRILAHGRLVRFFKTRFSRLQPESSMLTESNILANCIRPPSNTQCRHGARNRRHWRWHHCIPDLRTAREHHATPVREGDSHRSEDCNALAFGGPTLSRSPRKALLQSRWRAYQADPGRRNRTSQVTAQHTATLLS